MPTQKGTKEFVIGKRIATEGNFRVGGNLRDPVTVRVYVRPPGGPTVTYEYGPGAPDLVREAEGVYRFEFELDEVGTWAIRWEGTGDVEAVDEELVTVLASAV